jgi:hypothetical protein
MSRYSNFTLNSGEYVPQYAGSPLNVINDTNTELQNRHYRNIADMSALDLALKQMQSKAVGKGQEYIANQIGQVSSALQDLAANGAENSTAKVAALRNQFLGDQGVLRSMEVAQAYNKFLEEKKKTPNPLYNKQLEQDILNTPVKDEQGNLTSVYSNPLDFKLQSTLNYMAKQDDVVKPLTADSWQGDLKVAKSVAGLAGMTDNEFLQTTKGKELSKSKVEKYLFAPAPNAPEGLGWKSYKDSPEYIQQSEMLSMSDKDIKAELLSRGLAKVYTDIDKQFIRNPMKEGAKVTGGENSTAPTVTVPSPAVIRNIDTLNRLQKSNWGSADDITKKGIKKDFIDKSLDFLTNELEDILATTKSVVSGTRDEVKSLRAKRKEEILNGDNIDAIKTQQALEDAKVVFDVFGLTKSEPTLKFKGFESTIPGRQPRQVVKPKDMAKEELLDLASSPKGKEMIKAYQEMYQKIRYDMPFIQIPVEEGARQANEDFIRGTFDNRQIIDPSTGKALTMRDEKGNVRPEFVDLHTALIKKEAIYNGRFTPQNLLTQSKGADKKFVRGLKITIPTEEGKNSKEYFVSELPGLTKPSDINENVLWNKATEKPGAQASVGKDVKVQTLITPEQKENVFNEQSPKWVLDFPQLTKEMFMSGQAVIVTLPNGDTVPFMNYTKAAEYLANNGIILD